MFEPREPKRSAGTRFEAVRHWHNVHGLSGSLGPGDLEPMMAATGQALQAALPGVRPQALEYANNELRLRGIDPADDALATLQERLATAGYPAQADDSALVVRVEDGQ